VKEMKAKDDEIERLNTALEARSQKIKQLERLISVKDDRIKEVETKFQGLFSTLEGTFKEYQM
jgi:predicted  nucleic acid-binding Zn-ribbon protein